MTNQPNIAYLFSRYPVVSQTFCDTEMLALEAMGFRITVGSLNPPPTSFRHERLDSLRAEVIYPPPSAILDLPITTASKDPVWLEMAKLADAHLASYGASFKPHTRARNACYFAREFKRRGIGHVHVHFANRATHTALFLKKAGLTFSFTAHAQDFMCDLGSDDLLRELAREAEFVVAVSDFSRNLLVEKCPDAAGKIVRIHNGIDAAQFVAAPRQEQGPMKILSVGRLIEFKGFHHLISAVGLASKQGTSVSLDIIGEGPWRPQLEAQINQLGLEKIVTLRGVLSQDQIKKALATSDVFALGCVVDEKGACDILPTVILEALAARLPVVSTTLAGVPEMVVHEESGLLSAPGNAPEMAHHLTTLAADPARRRQFGLAGRDRVEKLFPLADTAGQLAAHFSNLTNIKGTAIAPPPEILALTSIWPVADTREALALAEEDRIGLLAANCPSVAMDAPLPANVHFLPDAMVLESSWRNSAHWRSQAEALYEKCGSVDGEYFFQQARRALQTLVLCEKWGIRHVHALRSAEVLWAWLVKKIGRVGASFTVEHQPTISRSALEIMLPDFDFGSLSDERLGKKMGDKFPNLLPLGQPPARSGLFKAKAAPPQPDYVKIWKSWVERIS